MPIKVSFIYCIEKGELEKQAILSIKSLRKNGGVYSKSRIYCVCPREKRCISKDSIEVLQNLGVNYIVKNLNYKYENYPLANKPLVCSNICITSAKSALIFI